ncbi:MAG: YdcF family protein [Gammaproteobacteria bacterium]|nr:YdcF family protein [Gammaproteobacteria bacterium]MDX5375388.1 YdcF family protein [Gammaproteobacteria bacterium]
MVARLVETLILPPGGPLLLALTGLLLVRLYPRFGRTALVLGLALSWALSTPLVAYGLLDTLQYRYPTIQPAEVTGDRIVVLGAGRQRDATEYGGHDVPSAYALERLRYGVYLLRETDAQLILTGGRVHPDERESEALLSARVLARDYDIGVVQLEEQSRNTCENAFNAGRLLELDRVERATVVTHAWHMPRAMWCFERAGIPAQAAPTGLVRPGGGERGVFALLPSARALLHTRIALHELVGMLWYRLVY